MRMKAYKKRMKAYEKRMKSVWKAYESTGFFPCFNKKFKLGGKFQNLALVASQEPPYHLSPNKRGLWWDFAFTLDNKPKNCLLESLMCRTKLDLAISKLFKHFGCQNIKFILISITMALFVRIFVSLIVWSSSVSMRTWVWWLARGHYFANICFTRTWKYLK